MGFLPPLAGTVMCAYLVVWDAMQGRLPEPRPCKRAAHTDSPYCGLHKRVAARVLHVEVRDGGFCIGCSQPGRSYVLGGVTIPLCAAHGRALERALREGR